MACLTIFYALRQTWVSTGMHLAEPPSFRYFPSMILAPDKWDPRWDERFSQEGYFYGKEPNDFLKAHSCVFKNQGQILCIAEGEGRNAVFLAKQGFQVTAMDGSKEALKKLSLLAQEQKVSVKTELGDLVRYSMGEEQWDGIVSIWCHLPRPLWKKMLRQIALALKPGGIFLLEGYTPEQLNYPTGGPSNPDWMATLEDLKEVFADFKLLEAQELLREIQEGEAHQGLSAVVQFIAVRT